MGHKDGRENKTSNGERRWEALAWGLLGAVLVLLLAMNLLWGDHWIDSDMAAEMIFSRLLAQEGKWIATENWYYSTEFRVLYTQLVMVPLFHVLGDWHMIRTITNLVTYLLLLGAYFYCMKPLKTRKSTVIFTSVILLLPFSETFLTHMQMGNTYMWHVLLILLAFGMFLRLSQPREGGAWRRGLTWGLYMALSVVCGLSGVRYLLALQVPLCITAGIYILKSGEFALMRKEFDASCAWRQIRGVLSQERLSYLLCSLLGLLCAGVGYVVNVAVLGHKFQFQMYDVTNFIKVFQGVLLERTQDTAGNLLQLFGYIEEKGFLSVRGLISLVAFGFLGGILFLTVRCARLLAGEQGESGPVGTESGRERGCFRLCHSRFILWFFVTAFVLNTFVFLFTTSTIVARYYITVFLFVLPLLCIYFTYEELPLDRRLLTLLLCGALGLTTAKCVYSFADKDKNQDRRPVAAFLEEQGYTFGYASYWNGNILTELTDGKVEVANIHEIDRMDPFTWSSPVKYYREGYHQGKTFLLLTDQEAEEYARVPAVAAGRVVYEEQGYVVLHYDSTEEVLSFGTDISDTE
ncbi:MAG: hypothetical protein HFH81_04035 [Lachnospiraceae bacterium]|nr:hypothetical protein [Lachnospiraceae bacterium]